jgi:hypothetical protein
VGGEGRAVAVEQDGRVGIGGEEMEILGIKGEGWEHEGRAPAADLRDAVEGRD